MAVSKKSKKKTEMSSPKKVFVLDTNVLLHDPDSFLKFSYHTVIIPITVIEELDKLKKSPGELGKNARHAIRRLDTIQQTSSANIYQGIQLDNEGSFVRIAMEVHRGFEGVMDLHLNDNKIILCAFEILQQGLHVVFVSKDFAARIKAEAIGLKAQDYENLKVAYEGIKGEPVTVILDKHTIDTFFKDGILPLQKSDFIYNQYVHITDGAQTSTVARYDSYRHSFIKLIQPQPMWGIKAQNMGQKCAIDALLRDEIKLVTLIGHAGTGKTLLALAAGMKKVFDEGAYRKILISRPIVPLGRDIGYLPGTKEEKLSHWMQPIFDNLELLCVSKASEPSDIMQWIVENKKIEIEAVTYIRGRSLPKMFIIIDEAQNLTPHEIKTIISRAGEGTKVVLCGDPTQIDNPYLDINSNGLTYTFGKFKNQPIAAAVYLEKIERSELAAIATEIL